MDNVYFKQAEALSLEIGRLRSEYSDSASKIKFGEGMINELRAKNLELEEK